MPGDMIKMIGRRKCCPESRVFRVDSITQGIRNPPSRFFTTYSLGTPCSYNMSFFGFTQANDLEEERRRYLEGGLNGSNNNRDGQQLEDVAVYTWGEESYDGLGDALQERGDELNDETFGGTGTVGGFQFDSCSFCGPFSG